MSKRRIKKLPRQFHLSPGALPAKLADQFNGKILVFSDASKKTHAGIAAVLFASNNSDHMAFASTCHMTGSNELELEAALFAVSKARLEFPDEDIALFSDNQDTVSRLNNAQINGIDSDPVLAKRFFDLKIDDVLNGLSINWIKSHFHCRGNALADQYAREAANQHSGK